MSTSMMTSTFGWGGAYKMTNHAFPIERDTFTDRWKKRWDEMRFIMITWTLNVFKTPRVDHCNYVVKTKTLYYSLFNPSFSFHQNKPKTVNHKKKSVGIFFHLYHEDKRQIVLLFHDLIKHIDIMITIL